MDKKRALEILSEYVDEIPRLKSLNPKNEELKLWLKKVEELVRLGGFDPDDQQTYQKASQFLRFLRNPNEVDLIHKDYVDEITRYEIALRSIVQKYEIFGTIGESDKEGGIKKMDKKKQINMSIALDKLKQYKDEIQKLEKLNYNNLHYPTWITKVEELLNIVNPDDCHKFKNRKLYSNLWSNQDEYLGNLTICKATLESIIDKYEISETNSPSLLESGLGKLDSPLQLFDSMQFHPKVVEVCESLFKTRNYSQAILEAFKAINNYVKDKTGLTLDGTNLMESVFSENKPILKLNELLTDSHKNEQKGFKYIFMGGQLGIRNLNAHEYVKLDDPSIAIEYLCMASLLMKRIDESKLVKLNIKD